MTKVFVHAPLKSDLGEPIIRIHEDLMMELEITVDDFVYIMFKKNQLIAKPWPLYSGDKFSVRLDFPFLKALNITFGDAVEIEKAV